MTTPLEMLSAAGLGEALPRLSGHVDLSATRNLFVLLEKPHPAESTQCRIDCADLLSAPPQLFQILATRTWGGDANRLPVRLERLEEPFLTALALAGFSSLTGAVRPREQNAEAAAADGALPGHPEEARALISELETAVAALNPQGRILFVNRAFEQLLGYQGRQIRGQDVVAFFRPASEGEAAKSDASLLAGGATGRIALCRLRVSAVRRDRDEAVLRVASFPLRDGTWPARAVFCVVPESVQESVRPELAPPVHEASPDLWNRTIPVPLFGLRLGNGRLSNCNDRFARAFGYESRDEALAEFALGAHLAPAKEAEGLLRRLAEKKEVEEDHLFLTRGNEHFWGRVAACVGADSPDCAEGAVMVANETKRLERELRESEQRAMRLVDTPFSFSYTARVRKGQTISVRASASCEAFTGYSPEDFAANPLLLIGVVHDTDKSLLLNQVRQILTGSQVAPVVYRICHRDSSLRWIRSSAVATSDASGEIVRYDMLIDDVTENYRLREELRQAEKMQAVGQLTGGIAHDFNNLLTGILGNLSLAELDAPETIRPNLSEAQRAAERAVSLVRQLLTFSRKGPSLIEQVGMAGVIAEVAEIVRNTFDRRIEILTECAADLHPILGDATRMHQVVLNLCLNARDALEEMTRVETSHTDLHIRISARNVQLDEAACKGHPRVRPGAFVEIAVADNGIGMNGDVRERIFDPFFTTKENDKGTGLGLSTVRSIVEQHEGWIEVESKPRRGATFRVLLPQASRPTVTPTPIESLRMPCGHETILVVDDERLIRDMLRNVLQRLGYKVLLAADGAEGTETYRRHFQRIDLVILDMSMPALSGGEVLRQIRAINPSARVVVSSGYSTLRIDGEDSLWRNVDILAKPYRPARLAQTVRQSLDKSPALDKPLPDDSRFGT